MAASAQQPAAQIAAEVERLQRSLKESPPATGDSAGVATSVATALKSAADALASRRVYLALGSLAQAMDLFEGMKAYTGGAQNSPNALADFEARWNKESLALSAVARDVRAKNWNAAPAALRALSEVALGKSTPLMDGSRGFALATGPQDGLFYMGQARGEAEFARFCAGLGWKRQSRPWRERSMLAELLELQDKANAAFQPPQSIEQHPRFIALNSSIKLARELDAGKAYHGSFYQYLESVRQYGMLNMGSVSPERQEGLKTALATEQKKWAGSGQDGSIALIFIERSLAQVAHPDGSSTTADEWRSAQVVLEQVLPAYVTALKAPLSIRSTNGKTVDVTLVRWPYT